MQNKKNQGFLGAHKTAVFRGKRGISGIEMTVSFALFISFLIFIFAYMNPLQMPASRSSLTALEAAVAENATIGIETIPFAVNKTLLAGKSCFFLEGYNLGTAFISDKNGNAVSMQGDNIAYTGEKFYYINMGGGIAGTGTLNGCIQLPKGAGYTLSVPRTEKYYYNKSLTDIKNLYQNNYNLLKQNFKIPTASDFAIMVFDENKNEIFSMTKPLPRVNILAKEFPIEILFENGKLSKGYLRLLTW